jgi:uncharacterized protein YwqG
LARLGLMSSSHVGFNNEASRMLLDFLTRWLRPKRSKLPERSVRDLTGLLDPLAASALHLTHTFGPSRSHLGGQPRLPEHVVWPQKDGKPLDFIARLSIAELRAVHPIEWLPPSGALLFFYSLKSDAWGFDPKDRGKFAVLHVPDLPEALPHTIANHPAPPIREQNVAIRLISTWPTGYERPSLAHLDLTDQEHEELSSLTEAVFRGEPKHQVCGYPSPVQGDHMELECQLVTNGLYCGNQKGYRDPRAKALEAGAANWRLLLQFDTDDRLDIMWGDGGTLYFWVEEQRSRVGDFSNAWVIQQCH